jgi:N-acetylmuramoyl-L-alanine amidase
LPDNSLFTSVTAEKNGDRTVYKLTLKDGQSLEGYYTEKTAAGLAVYFKRHIKANLTAAPLSGITIMVDPGHGGSESGAIGPMGPKYAEKSINLDTALKLRDKLAAMGAQVIMTRDKDITLSLSERLAMSRKSKPDMFIAIHSDSAEDNVDLSKVTGFSAFYRNDQAGKLTNIIYDNVIVNRNKRGIDVKNFYVIRGTWTMSLLLEGGFVPNPDEFEWLSDPNSQEIYAQSIAQAIANYFSE